MLEDYDKNRITTIIHLENELRKIANLKRLVIQEKLKDFIGKKIIKVDGTLLKKVSDLIDFDRENITVKPLKVGDYAKVHYIYLNPSTYDLSFKIGINVSGGYIAEKNYYCIYREDVFYFGKMEKGVLKEFYQNSEKELLDLDKELKLFELAKDKKKEFEEVKYKLHWDIANKL